MIGHKLTEEEIDKLLSSKPIAHGEFIAGAVYIILVVIAIVMFFCSCSTSNRVEAYAECHRDSVRTDDLIVVNHKESCNDSVITEHSAKDSMMVQQMVIDSTVIERTIETIITNTVDTTGRLIGTDKVTMQYVNRDHWRNTDINSYKVKSENISNKAKSANIDSTNTLISHNSTIVKSDSINHNQQTTIEKKRTLWEKIKDKAVNLFLCVFSIVGLACIGRIGYKYIKGK